jgi:hypothetical protein
VGAGEMHKIQMVDGWCHLHDRDPEEPFWKDSEKSIEGDCCGGVEEAASEAISEMLRRAVIVRSGRGLFSFFILEGYLSVHTIFVCDALVLLRIF